jgi:soluble lytic murein transglycosylase-like protein
MQITRHVPHFRSIKASVLTLFALFVVVNVTDVPLLAAVAPTVSAQIVAQMDADRPFVNPADIPTSGDAEIDEIIYRAGEQYGVDPRLLHAVVLQESRYDADAKSHAGAQGLMQLMAPTASRFKCDDRNDPRKNVDAGTRYLRFLLKRFEGNVKLALAGYNAGEGNVDKYKGIPPFPETENYVKKIVANYGKTHHPVVAPQEARAAFNLTAPLPAPDAAE